MERWRDVFWGDGKLRFLKIFISGFVVGGILFSSVPRAEGAACCVSATVGGVGRLKIWEKFAFGLNESLASELGFWDSETDFHFHSDYRSLSFTSNLWGIVGWGRRASFHFLLPILLNYRAAGKQSEWGGGIGDLQLGFRYEIISIGEFRQLPAIALTLSAIFPTGRSVESSQSVLGADISGAGIWALALGLSFEKTFYPWFIRFDFRAKFSIPSFRSDLDGILWQNVFLVWSLLGGIELVRDTLVLAWGASFNWRGNTYLDGEQNPDSQIFYPGAFVSLSWAFHPHWSTIFSLSSDLFIPAIGKDRNAIFSGTIGIRYAFF